MSDWEADNDEDPSQTNPSVVLQEWVPSVSAKSSPFGGERSWGTKPRATADRGGPQWENWRETERRGDSWGRAPARGGEREQFSGGRGGLTWRRGDRDAGSSAPLSFNVESSMIGAVIGMSRRLFTRRVARTSLHLCRPYYLPCERYIFIS